METPSGPLRITISLGGVATANWPDDNANQVPQMIDAALYRAKEEGRVVTASAAEHEEAHQSTLEFSLRAPVENNNTQSSRYGHHGAPGVSVWISFTAGSLSGLRVNK
jgi:GGDEF domain-containing protein